MAFTLKLVFPGLPPTSNKIYFRGTQLTAKAREFKEAFKFHVAQNYGHLMNGLNRDGIYAVHLRIFMEVVNVSWNNPDLPPSKRSKERYKKVDLDNRIKLLTDCVRDAIDIDDSRIFAGSQEKQNEPDPEKSHVEIYIQEVDPRDFGL